MLKKRFLASILALLMVFSLLPAASITASAEEEGQIRAIDADPETEPEIEAVEPEQIVPVDDDPAEPEADPVAYDLWVCGVQVTSANKQSIDGKYMVRFDPDTNTLTIYTNAFINNNSTQLHEGALIYSALPDLTVDLQLKADDPSKFISSDAAQSMIYVENGSLTIVTKEGTTPQLKSNSAKVGIDVHGGSFTLNGNLYMYSKSEQIGINVPDGTVTLNGGLNMILSGDTADSCIYAENGLTSTSALSVDCYECTNGFGIKVMNGPITINGGVSAAANHCGIYCGNGDVSITGFADFKGYNMCSNALCPTCGLYVANGEVTMGAFGMFGGAEYVVYASGSIHVTEDLEFENTGNFGRHGIKSEHGGIVIDGSATITAAICLDAGDSTEGILVKGDLTLTPAGRYGAVASNGPITVQGNMDVRDASYTAVLAKGDITVEGNATASASTPAQFPEFPGNAMESTDGSINVSGNLKCTGTRNNCYAKNDIRVGGNADFSNGTTAGDFNAKAENGEISVGGTLTCEGKAAYSVWAGTSVTVEKDVTITNDAEGSVGMKAAGFLNFVSGKWDVTATTAALQAGNGIQIPEGFGVTLPGRGIVAQVDGLHTVTASDGSTVAAHAIIEAKNYEEGYYLIGPDWTLTGIIPTDKFETNPSNTNEYMLTTKLAVGDKIKVVKLTDGAITAWYPEGIGNEYTVDQAHAGTVKIYFKTTYDSAWSEFGGFIYIEHMHDWGKPTWTWTETEDGYTATATFVCGGDPSHTVTLDAVVTVEKSYDCEWGTFVDYTATVEFEGKEYKGYKYFEYPDGHPWGEPTWTWADDNKSATATFVCTENASHTKTLNATITSVLGNGVLTLTATVELDGETYTDTKELPVAQTYGSSISLKGNIGLNFFVILPETLTSDADAYVTLNEKQYPIAEASTRVVGELTLYQFSYEVPAKCMNDVVTLRVFDGEGNELPLFRYSDGEDLSETGYQTSIQEYIQKTRETSTDAKLLALLDAMSDYGSMAQLQFEYNADTRVPVLADLSQVTVEDLASYEYTISPGKYTGVSFNSASLSLQSETALRIYFDLTEGEIGDYTFKLGTKVVEPYESSGRWVVEISNIAAKDLDRLYTVTVTSAAGKVLTVKACALGYCYRVLASDRTSDTLKDTVRAIYLYNQAANAYFA